MTDSPREEPRPDRLEEIQKRWLSPHLAPSEQAKVWPTFPRNPTQDELFGQGAEDVAWLIAEIERRVVPPEGGPPDLRAREKLESREDLHLTGTQQKKEGPAPSVEDLAQTCEQFANVVCPRLSELLVPYGATEAGWDDAADQLRQSAAALRASGAGTRQEERP